eukprot:763273-Hanusia_phi.AAC.3
MERRQKQRRPRQTEKGGGEGGGGRRRGEEEGGGEEREEEGGRRREEGGRRREEGGGRKEEGGRRRRREEEGGGGGRRKEEGGGGDHMALVEYDVIEVGEGIRVSCDKALQHGDHQVLSLRLHPILPEDADPKVRSESPRPLRPLIAQERLVHNNERLPAQAAHQP